MLGAYWGPRPTNLEQCAQSAVEFFAALATADPLLSNWYQRGRSRKDALERKVDPAAPQELRDLIAKGRNRRDVDQEVIEELGFRVSLWNGATTEEAEASVSIQCGSYNDRVGNNVLLDLPNATDAQWVENASSMLKRVVEIWQPAWAGIMSERAMRERPFDGSRPFVDWMVYVPRRVDQVPPPGRIKAIEGLGSIVIVQPDPPTGNGLEEKSLIKKIESLLAG